MSYFQEEPSGLDRKDGSKDILQGRTEVEQSPKRAKRSMSKEAWPCMVLHARAAMPEATYRQHGHHGHAYNIFRPFSLISHFFLSFFLESTLERDFRVSLKSCYLCFWIKFIKIGDCSTPQPQLIQVCVLDSLFLSLTNILGFWLNHVYWIGICACCLHYDSRLNLPSCIGISPCYVELNYVLGCCNYAHAYESDSHLICQFVYWIAWKSFIHCS